MEKAMIRKCGLSILLFVILFLVAPIFGEVAEVSEGDIVQRERPSEGVVIGEVVSLDTASNVIVVETADGLKDAFSVVDDETILWEGIEDIELTDINKGKQAEIGYYTDEKGKLIASWVDVLREEAVPKIDLGTGKKESPKENN